MRYQGQSFEIPVLLDEDTVQSGDLARFAAYFHQEHLRLYSHSDEAAEVEYVKARVRVIGSIISPKPNPMSTRCDAHDALAGTRAISMRGKHYPSSEERRVGKECVRTGRSGGSTC